MRNKLPLLLTITLILMVSGCSNVKDANKENFKKSAQQLLDTIHPYYYIRVKLPFQMNSLADKLNYSFLDVLLKHDVVKSTETSRIQRRGALGSGSGEDILFLYDLTSKGEKYYKESLLKDFSGKPISGFCFGKAEVDEVISFTKPADFKGVKVSRVTYTYKVSDIPEFAKDPALFTLNSKLKADVLSEEKPAKITHAFLLTDTGWVHESLVRREHFFKKNTDF